MKVPLNWLRDYVAVDVPTGELAARLTISTANVQRILRRGVEDSDGNLDLYRVGRVVEAGKHPNADRLQLCRVDVGEGEPRQIVCGAWNFGAGATVAVALPGAVLPGGQRLEAAKLRGAVSEGMILSERELDLGTDHTGILVFEDGPEPGTLLGDVLALGEDVLELETTPNRPDLLSMYGVAREVAALFDAELHPLPGTDPRTRSVGDEDVDIRVEDLERCPVYIGRVFREVTLAPSPAWLKARLVAAGMRPISNVVDVTNYVMHALGSPLHAFDQSKLHEGRIVVRRAEPGEEIRTLDGNLRVLTPEDLVIADADRPIAIAGIMGGEDSEVTEETTDVLLEAANFEPVGILRSSERLGLRSEASNRWEKGIDPNLAEAAARLATQLLVDLAGSRWAGERDVRGELPGPPVVRLRPERTDAIIGLTIDPDEQRALLERLGFGVGEDWNVTVPTWRARDVTREIDVIEEIARLKLDDVSYTLPRRQAMFGRLSKYQQLRRVVEDVLVGVGFSEAYTPSLVAEDRGDALRIPEPQSLDQAVLRTSLLPGLIGAARYNLSVGNEGIALFEIARVYLPQGEKLPHEPWHLAGIVEGGFGSAKGAIETVLRALKISPRFERGESPPLLHPGKTASFPGGVVGELGPGLLDGEWGAFEVDLEVLFEQVPGLRAYDDVITYPAVRQDLAFAVGEDIAAGDLVDAAREAAGAELREMTPFDVYRGEQVGPGRKSIAFRVQFRSPERTLTDEEAAGLREKIVDALNAKFGAELRA